MAGQGEGLRIAVVSHACAVGVNRVAWQAMVEHYGVEVTILAPRRWRTAEGRVFELEPTGGPARVVGLTVLGWGHPIVHLWPGLVRALVSLRPHVVFLDEEPYSLPAVQLVLARKRLRSALVVYAKQNVFKRYPPPFGWAERHLLQSADWMVAVAPPSRQVLEAKGCQAPVSVVPHAIDVRLYTPGDGQALRRRLGMTGPVVGYMGRLVPEKGVIDLLAAAARLAQRGRRCNVLIVGSGPERRRLRDYAERHLPGAVQFVGPVPHDQSPDYYRCMDVLVLPSRDAAHWREQLGRTLLEALACGIPVVGSDGGSIPGVIAATAGKVFRQGDVEDLARAIETLLADEGLRRELAERGRERVVREFSAEAIAGKLYEVARRAWERYRSRAAG